MREQAAQSAARPPDVQPAFAALRGPDAIKTTVSQLPLTLIFLTAPCKHQAGSKPRRNQRGDAFNSSFKVNRVYVHVVCKRQHNY